MRYRNENRSRFQSVVLASLGALLLAGSAAAGPSGATAVTACNTVISVSGSYYLDNDLNCNGASLGVGIIASNVDFDLKGHTIFNNFTFTGEGIGTGVHPFDNNSCVAATGVHIHGGTIAGFHTGIVLCSPSGKNTALNAVIDHVASIENVYGIAIYGPVAKNQIETNTFGKNATGMYLGSSNNDIGNNLFVLNGLGFYVDSPAGNNTIHNNTVTAGTNNVGLVILGSNNAVQANTFAGNAGYGIELRPLAAGNKITANVGAYNNQFDAVDDNGFCGLNIWQNNLFGGKTPACIQ